MARFRESASPPRRAEPVAWSASAGTSRDGGCIFAAAPNADTSDAAIHRLHSMPAPTQAAPATPSSPRSNRGRTGFTRPRRNGSSAARSFRIRSPGHRNSRYLHRLKKYRQTGRSRSTGKRGHRTCRSAAEVPPCAMPASCRGRCRGSNHHEPAYPVPGSRSGQGRGRKSWMCRCWTGSAAQRRRHCYNRSKQVRDRRLSSIAGHIRAWLAGGSPTAGYPGNLKAGLPSPLPQSPPSQ